MTSRKTRRQVFQLATGAAVLPVSSRIAEAQTYPTRPVHLIVGVTAGSGGDIIARLVGQWLSEHLGQPFVVVNQPGAGTNIAAEAVAHAPPDGYTLLQTTAANAINTTLYENLNFDFTRDLVAVASVNRSSLVMEVNPSVPAETVPEFIVYAKANPGKINMASPGNGTVPHVAGELFKMMTGVNMLHVPYRGEAQVLTDLIGGQVQVYFGPQAGSIEFIKAGKLRPLAVTSTTRSAALPDIPTVGGYVPGYEARVWTGIGAPKNAPDQIIDKLNREINAGLTDRKIMARLAELGSEPMPLSATEFSAFVAAETAKWAKVVKFANIKPQ